MVAEDAGKRIALAIETDNEEPETIAALSVLIHLNFQLERREDAERNLRYLERVLVRNAQEWPSVPDLHTLITTTGPDFNAIGPDNEAILSSLEDNTLQKLSCGLTLPERDDLRGWNGLYTMDASCSQASDLVEAPNLQGLC